MGDMGILYTVSTFRITFHGIARWFHMSGMGPINESKDFLREWWSWWSRDRYSKNINMIIEHKMQKQSQWKCRPDFGI
jgi:hypothetical protein